MLGLRDSLMSKLGFGLVATGALVGLYFAALYFAQRSLLFPAPLGPLPADSGRAEVVHLSLTGGDGVALFLAPTTTPNGPAPLVLFTHGNAELADYWISAFEEMSRWGWAVLLVEYPGYGRSAGTPSEGSINEAVLAAYDWAQRDPRIDSARIVPYGRSLGGGPAVRLATERHTPALILESSFTSVRDFAARFLAPSFLVRDRFDNLDLLRSYRGPLLVVHGSRDDIVPIAHGRALAAAVAGAEFHEALCGHNDCPRPWPAIKAFLQKNRLMPPASPE
jgi:pimeloyl-ACP methyl ester carboxylesterase